MFIVRWNEVANDLHTEPNESTSPTRFHSNAALELTTKYLSFPLQLPIYYPCHAHERTFFSCVTLFQYSHNEGSLYSHSHCDICSVFDLVYNIFTLQARMAPGQRNWYGESLQAVRFWARIPTRSINLPFSITVHTGSEAQPTSSAMDTMAVSGSEAEDTTPCSALPSLHGKLWGALYLYQQE